MDVPTLIPLRCQVQQYAWGKIGADSAVAQLSKAGNPDFQLEEDKPYAELWMGTHVKAPSMAVVNDEVIPLSELLRKHEALCGNAASKDGSLPYLFKVLAVNKTLSIQAHPDKALAARLHAADPAHYPDANHKPEMALAITPFEGMCGFRQPEDIAQYLKTVPELKAVVGDAADKFVSAVEQGSGIKPALQEVFTALMKAQPEQITQQLSALEQRLSAVSEGDRDLVTQFVLRLCKQYPGDGGVFCLYLLNIVQLQPGEAMFLGPNVPHAYIAGNCVECMACSDNVVRAGCTPKFKDVDNLCQMLTYETGSAQDQLFSSQPHPEEERVAVFDPPVPDFKVASIKLQKGETLTLPAEPGPSILLVLEGGAQVDFAAGGSKQTKQIKAGDVYFAAAKQTFGFTAEQADTTIHRAYV
eukprot:TRINITY_DN15087_c0_g1_i1.p1 TRINITY_DN15087_c0_g1~~TRINITY_DN15087_c0_g1_i1.p1  ORF type:complete len:414 (+),score=111.46 TRINITY_DN15087_c0_g1_i1:36-1277(+)